MRCSMLFGLLALLSLGSTGADGLKFVFLPLMGGNSPSMDLMGVAAKLHARGHAVMVVVAGSGLAFAKQAAARHSSNTTAEDMQYVGFNMTRDPTEDLANILKSGQHPGKFSSLMMLAGIMRMLARPCAMLLQDKQTLEQVRNYEADAIMGVPLPLPLFDSCGCVLSQLMGIPFIDINGHPMIDAPITVPQFGAGVTEDDLTSVSGFLKNGLAYVMRNLMPTLAMDYGPNPWKDLRRSAGLPRTTSNCLLTNALARLRGHQLAACRPLLDVMLGSFLLEHPRPLAAHQKVVGPGTPRPGHPIQPQAVADFVDAAGLHGVVLVAFGSTVQSVILTRKDLDELAEGFAALAPTRVLWGLSDKGLPEGVQLTDLRLGDNTKVVPWVDYNDVLGHPNTRVFVSHCGVHSVYEAAFHGVPVVAVPFQFEQAVHAARLVDRGVGVMSPEAPAFRKGKADPEHYTARSITSLIQQVMANTSYTQSARGIAVALQAYAAQRHPYERAADEIELAVHAAKVNQPAAVAQHMRRDKHREEL